MTTKVGLKKYIGKGKGTAPLRITSSIIACVLPFMFEVFMNVER